MKGVVLESPCWSAGMARRSPSCCPEAVCSETRRKQQLRGLINSIILFSPVLNATLLTD
ncbi:UNVERIFIED_CONTAM: hypothetical protein FKN15_017742 [Acipenser sinensis]